MGEPANTGNAALQAGQRVDDQAARLRERMLDTEAGVVRLTAAEAIADWVVARAAAHPGRVVLLATRIPQEPAVGLGVQFGQRSWDRTPSQQWPRKVYPVFHAGDRLAVPGLRLGAESVPGQRA